MGAPRANSEVSLDQCIAVMGAFNETTFLRNMPEVDQSFTVPSSPAEMRLWPSEENCNWVTDPACTFSTVLIISPEGERKTRFPEDVPSTKCLRDFEGGAKAAKEETSKKESLGGAKRREARPRRDWLFGELEGWSKVRERVRLGREYSEEE